MMKYLQKIGKALMLPVACLPAAALMLGIGYAIDPSGWGAGNPISAFLVKGGGAIIDNLPILFAVGVAIGMAKNNDGAAALSGLIGYLIVTTLLSSGTVAMFQGVDVAEVNIAFSKIQNAFTGILSGCIAGALYNRFSQTQLPTAFSFFAGKRCVPILTSVVMMLVSGLLYFAWPVIFNALVSFGTFISNLGAVGAGLYAFFNRLLIPTGLHHALNQVFWFDLADINDIGKYWGDVEGGIKGVTGMYQAGFFPIMMFGLPGGALAMWQAAKPEKKAAIGSLMLAGAVTAFVTGVTEPLEFSFMFVAPALYVVHAALTAVSLFICSTLQWTCGFAFSGGLIDFLLGSRLPLANKPFMLILLGLVFFVIYYVLFTVLIRAFNIMTPGREEDDVDGDERKVTLSNDDHAAVAKAIYDALGGADNVISIDNCVTRLRLEVKDSNAVDEKAIKAAGAAGIIRPGKDSIQVIIGTKVQFVADAMKEL